jgi:hypothetical protein
MFPFFQIFNRKKFLVFNFHSSEFFGEKILTMNSVLASVVPPKEDYIVVVSSNSNNQQQQQQQQIFSGVRVSRGTLATFGDDTAKQFALHVDKLLKERDGAATGGLLVRGGDVAPRAAFLKNGSVKVFEENVTALLNSSLKQREIRQREKDNMKQKTVSESKKVNEDDNDDDSSDDSSVSSSSSD